MLDGNTGTDHKSKGLVAVESLGEGSSHFADPTPPALVDMYNAVRRENTIFNQCMNIDISSSRDTKRSIHLSVHSASFKLPESMQKIGSSSVYCVVYALDVNGKHITPKNSQASTSALSINVGDNNPIWNEQFDLYAPDIVNCFDTVRVKVKMHKSGYIKDRNLGMVTLRAKDLFVNYSDRYETVKMKQFTLPMEECPNGYALAETAGSMKVCMQVCMYTMNYNV